MARQAKDEYQRDYTVTEPRTNPKGYTEYKVTAKFVSKTNPEDIKEVVVWKRYSDLRKLHGDLAYTHRHLFRRLEDFPAFPKAQVFGRFEPEVIEERRQAAETMLRFTVPIPALTNSPQLKEFFRGGEVRTPLDACSLPSLPPPLIPMPPGGLDETQAATEQLEPRSPGAEETLGAESYRLEGEDTGGDLGIREQQGDADLDALFAGGGLEDEDRGSPPPGALPPHDLALFDPVLAAGAEEEAEAAAEALWELDPGPGVPGGGYVAQATAQVRGALAREAAGDVAGALSCYRGAVQVLLQGLPGDPDAARREAVKRKTAEYLERAEALAQRHPLLAPPGPP
ncbi:sorting nexin-15 isoform X2 [Alligator mississippiensis]|uniref:sorting nexin-15 isoform X2 n=1 Tax=Alligator mississippiensis TaxID=8496 RepID=UPI0028774C3D|nr:sorting nexin-15 isoform X2 [Alligator mississippiensis]